MTVAREISTLDTNSNLCILPHLLDDCDLVEKLVATLRLITVSKNQFTSFKPTRLVLDYDSPALNGKSPSSSAENLIAPAIIERDKTYLPPSFVGHIMNICKAITHASEKSVKVRHLVASCSGYPIMFNWCHFRKI